MNLHDIQIFRVSPVLRESNCVREKIEVKH